MNTKELQQRMPRTLLAFRGYNVTNLGRTRELLGDSRYEPILGEVLQHVSADAARLLQRPVDLRALVEQNAEPSLDLYGELVALILAVEWAQLRILEEVHKVNWRSCQLMMGYSLGEIAALVAGGVVDLNEAMYAPLQLADDCAKLADNVQLAVLFSRGAAIDVTAVYRLCIEVNMSGQGVIGVSAILSPNSLLMMGQGDTLKRFRKRMAVVCRDRLYLRRNTNRWPPLHTPIMWQRNIPCRAAHLMHTMTGGVQAPQPPVLSLVTGEVSYTDVNARESIYRWIEQPQQLWLAVYESLSRGIETVIHVGPEPNIIPATFKRVSDNVEAQTKGSIGMRTLARIVQRQWLKSLLPERTALLRAPLIKQVILEDWLLEREGSAAAPSDHPLAESSPASNSAESQKAGDTAATSQ